MVDISRDKNVSALPEGSVAFLAPVNTAGEADSQGQLVVRGVEALRRRWLPALLLGLVCGAGAAAAAWKLQSDVYTAVAVLEIAPADASLLGDSPQADAEFGTYKQTQRELVGERSVVEAALLDPKLSGLSVIGREPDPAKWLSDVISVSFPGDAQIMHVEMTLPERDSVALLVNGVVDSYLDNIVRVRKNLDLRRKDYLERAYGKLKSSALQRRRQLDPGDEAASLPGPLAAHGAYLQRRLAVEVQRAELEAQYQALAEAPDDEVQLPSEEEIAAVVGSDPIFATDAVLVDLRSSRESKAKLAEQFRQRLREGFRESRQKEFEESIATLDEAIEKRERELAVAILENRRGTAALRRAALENQIALLEQQEQRFRQREDELWRQLENQRQAPQTAEHALQQIEIGAGEGFLQQLVTDIERLDVETQLDVDRSFERVRLLSPAKTPAVADEGLRLQLTAASAFAGFLAPFVLVLLDDLRRHRIGATSELEQFGELELMGTVPLVPSRLIRDLGSDRADVVAWRQRLREAINRVAAVLLRRQREHAVRVVLVTSAVQGEGKSTLAAQLAIALASSGRRTLLVDADMRRPRLHDTFSIDLSPGLTDVLAGATEVETAIRPMQTPNLSVLPAGEWIGDALAHLSSETSRAIFASLKTEYEFVIVDGSPVLQTVDPRLLGQFVDGVVFSLLRDVSTMPRLREACRVLKAFDIPLLGTVMTGSREQVYYPYAPPRKTRVPA